MISKSGRRFVCLFEPKHLDYLYLESTSTGRIQQSAMLFIFLYIYTALCIHNMCMRVSVYVCECKFADN